MSFFEEYAIFGPVIVLLMAVSAFLLNLSRDLYETEEKSTTPLGGGDKITSYKYASTDAQNLRDLIYAFSSVIFAIVKTLIIVIAISLGLAAVRDNQWFCTNVLAMLPWSDLPICEYLSWLIFSKQVLYVWLMVTTPILVWWLARLVIGVINQRARHSIGVVRE